MSDRELVPRAPRSFVTSVRVNRGESRLLTAAARRHGISLGAYLKQAALAAARAELAEETSAPSASLGMPGESESRGRTATWVVSPFTSEPGRRGNESVGEIVVGGNAPNLASSESAAS